VRIVNENSPTSRRTPPDERPALEADRRFALLVALIAPVRRDRARSRLRRDEGDRQEQSPQPPEGAEGRPALHWQGVIFLLFAGCAVAAVLFIVIASLIPL
jgi:hypothetical protein